MLWREFRFVLALWKANALSAMEYRVAFLSQVLGMMLNNAMYFAFWVIFFDRFKELGGWHLRDLFLVFGVAAGAFGLGVYLFGNVLSLAEVVSGGRLDYYLALPRPVLLHVLASRSVSSGLGDFTYGLLSFALAGYYTPDAILRFVLALLLAMTVFLAFLILVQSLSFWIGNSAMLTQQAVNGMITFALYPITLFDGTAKFFLFTLLPAAFMGAVPAAFVRAFSWQQLAELLGAATVFLGLAVFVFRRGLRRYESGSAIQTQV